MKNSRALLLVIMSGILLSMAWYEFPTSLVILIAFVPLLIVEEMFLRENKSPRELFLYSSITFVIWNVIATFWIYKATLFGAVAAVLINSFLMSFVFMLYYISRRIGKRFNGRYVLIFWWLVFEFLYFNAEISWPWLSLGNVFANNVKLIQFYEYTGVLGGSLLILLFNILIVSVLFEIIDSGLNMKRKIIANAIILFVLVVGVFGFSYYKYLNYKERKNGVEVVILQPNIDPYHEKFGSMSALDQVGRLIYLGDSLVTKKTKYVVGPETALVESIWENNINAYNSIQNIQHFITENPQLCFVVGASTNKQFSSSDKISKTARKFRNSDIYYDRYNSALQITKYDVDVYHKSKLVVGVEKLPYSRYLHFLDKFAINLGGTVGSLGVQKYPSVFTFKNSVVAPIICYESIYGSYVATYVRMGAELLFIITNDGWWGNTSGYKQHLSYARLRAIETRRDVARSANTGISAFINQRGDILKSTKWWTKDAIRATINENSKITFYVKYGDWIGRASLFVIILLLLNLFVVLVVNKRK